MKHFIPFMISCLSLFAISNSFTFVYAAEKIHLSSVVYNQVPFEDHFAQQGALIKNIHFRAVNFLAAQLEEIYPINLTHRGEAHITVITPPEAKGWNNNGIGVNTFLPHQKLVQKYKDKLVKADFEIICIGKRQDKASGKLVFYLVVDSPELRTIRQQIERDVYKLAEDSEYTPDFNASHWWPHITIGYVGDDIHGVSKGPETCIEDLELIIN